MKPPACDCSVSPLRVAARSRRRPPLAAGTFACVLLAGAGFAPGSVVVIEDFAAGVGRFDSPFTLPSATRGIFRETSSVTHDPAEGHDAPGSLRVFVDDDPETDARSPWILRVLSGGGRPENNVPFESTGYVGYWLKTTSPELQASLVLDDGGQEVAGRYRDVVPDGQWHLYEWDLDDPTPHGGHWMGNSPVDSPVVTVQSIFLRQLGENGRDWDALFWVDDLGHNPAGSLIPEPAHLSLLALGGACLARRRRR